MSPVLLYILAGFFVGNVTGAWHPLATFGKKPPVQQLTELQAQLTAQQQAAAEAAKQAEAAKVAEREKLEKQVRSAQLDNLGASTALKKVPKEHQTPEVKLAGSMVDRTGFKLGAAIGKLPPEEQQAMVDLIEELLSGKQTEVDAANLKLAQLDSDFKALTAQRQALEAQIPLLTQRAAKAEETVQATQQKVTVATNEVKAKAEALFKAAEESGSLWNAIKLGVGAVILLGLGYGFLAFILPGVVKHMAPDNPMKNMLRDASGYLTAPLLYSDAKKKIAEALLTPVPPKE